MRTRILVAALVLALVVFAAVRFAGVGSRVQPAAGPSAAVSVWDAARWAPGDPVTDVELLALDGRTPAPLLGRGANRPLILIVATAGSPALDRCASRWRELFEIYKDRVEFLTVFTAAPDSGRAPDAARVHPDASPPADPPAPDPHAVFLVRPVVAAARARVEAARTFVLCNNWLIPVLVDGAGDRAAAQFGTEPQVALILDEARRRLGAPVTAAVPSDLDAVNGWLRHRFAP